MSRSPLHALLRRAARLGRASRTLGIPRDELAPAVDEARRRLLVGGAAAAGLAAIEACASRVRAVVPPPVTPDHHVLVVGAGIAGLTAAWRLRQHGVSVQLVDAQPRVGGRMFSLRDHFADGQVAELGGELIDSNHEHLLAVAAELGIPIDDLHAGDTAVAHDVWDFGGVRRGEAEVMDAFAPIGGAIERDLANVGVDGIGYANPGVAATLDRMSIAQWLDARGVGGWMRDLLDVAYTTEFGLPIDRQSSLNLLTMLDPRATAFELYGASDERYHLRGGNDALPRAVAAALGDESLILGARLVALGSRPSGGWRATVERGASTFTVDATHVVLALPFTLLRDVAIDAPLPPVKRRAIAELGYGTNAKLMVGFEERVWRTRHHSNGSVFSARPFQTTWEASRAQPGASGILTNFTGGAHGLALGDGTAAEQATRFVAQLEGIFPGATAARANRQARFHWPSFPWTRGSYASYLTGQWTSLRGAEGETVGTLYFAGEHTSLVAQGFMEGGCESGERVARQVLASLGVSARRSRGDGQLALRRRQATDRRIALRVALAGVLGRTLRD